MRHWSIRRKLLALPAASIAVLAVGVGGIALAVDRRLVLGVTGILSVAVLLAAWRTANDIADRLMNLRRHLAELLRRELPDGAHAAANHDAAALVDDRRDGDPRPDAGAPGDELQRLADAINQALRRSRERESQLRRSSEVLQFAQAAGGIGVFNLDLVTGQVTGTPLLFELLALPDPGAALTRDEWFATIHPEDLEAVIAALNQAIPGAGKFEVDYRTLRLDGGPRWLACRGDVLLDAEGLPARAIGTLTDVTERKQLEESLQHAAQSLDIAQGVAGIATMDLNFGRRRSVASDNFHELLGIARATPLDDLDGHLAAVHPEDVERVRRAPFDTTPQNPAFQCEYRVILEEGTERWIAQTASVVHGRGGEILRITGALVDVTYLRNTEAALRCAMSDPSGAPSPEPAT